MIPALRWYTLVDVYRFEFVLAGEPDDLPFDFFVVREQVFVVHVVQLPEGPLVRDALIARIGGLRFFRNVNATSFPRFVPVVRMGNASCCSNRPKIETLLRSWMLGI